MNPLLNYSFATGFEYSNKYNYDIFRMFTLPKSYPGNEQKKLQFFSLCESTCAGYLISVSLDCSLNEFGTYT